MAGMEYWSACELAGQIRAGKVTSLAAVEFFIDRIERLDAGRTNNVVVKTYESARRRAKEADAALAKGESWGVLHGMPMTVKESYAIVGVQTTCGMSRFMEPEPFKPAVNAAVVHRVLGQGAIIIGKTNLPELAADMQSYNSIYGTTRSAWNMDHTPGGSSGGGAGAVACGLTPVEIGSDIGGSIRQPAHFSGICGHKPSQGVIDKFGMVPPYPMSLNQETLAVAGPLARNCGDLSLMLDILSGPEPERAAGGWSLTLPPPAVTDPAKLRVAVWADDPFCPVDTEYVSLIKAAAETLSQAGAVVDHRARPALTFEESNTVYGPTLADSMSGKGVSGKLNNERLKLKKKWAEFWAGKKSGGEEGGGSSSGGFDVLLCPVTPTAALRIDESQPSHERPFHVNGQKRQYWDNVLWNGLTIIADLPVTVVKIGHLSNGLPVGVQIVAPVWQDKQALEVGAMLEKLHPGTQFAPPPGYERGAAPKL